MKHPRQHLKDIQRKKCVSFVALALEQLKIRNTKVDAINKNVCPQL
jgi:hypothetical protein